MNRYEELLDEAIQEGLYVIENAPFESSSAGLINGDVIGLNKNLETTTEKACVLAEELGHHHTTVGNILDIDIAWNRKQERQARLNGYNRLIGLIRLIEAYESGCQSRYEIAQHLDVTEEYLQECIDCYTDKYGVGVSVGDYYVTFIPYLSVMKLI